LLEKKKPTDFARENELKEEVKKMKRRYLKISLFDVI